MHRSKNAVTRDGAVSFINDFDRQYNPVNIDEPVSMHQPSLGSKNIKEIDSQIAPIVLSPVRPTRAQDQHRADTTQATISKSARPTYTNLNDEGDQASDDTSVKKKIDFSAAVRFRIYIDMKVK